MDAKQIEARTTWIAPCGYTESYTARTWDEYHAVAKAMWSRGFELYSERSPVRTYQHPTR